MTRTAKPPVAVFSALGDSTRCRILALLQPGPVPVHKLAAAFSISRPAISRHLRVLKEAGLVAEVKKGRENLYALRPAPLGKAKIWLEQSLVTPEPKKPTPAKVVVKIEPKPVKSAPKPVAKPVPPPMAPANPINQMGFDF